MFRTTTFSIATLGLVLSVVSPALAAGSGHEHTKKADPSGQMSGMEALEAKLADTSTFGTKGNAAKVTKTVKIEATEIKYDTEALQFKVGQTVKFVLTNKGEQPHELTIGDASYQETAREMMTHMAEMGMDMGSPEHAAEHANAGNTVIVPVGETKELVWTFTKPGNFEFSCNMPGHAEVGMKGPITVS